MLDDDCLANLITLGKSDVLVGRLLPGATNLDFEHSAKVTLDTSDLLSKSESYLARLIFRTHILVLQSQGAA